MKYLLSLLVLSTFILSSCGDSPKKKTEEKYIVQEVDSSLFLKDANNLTIEKVACTLSDGTTTDCYKITTNGIPKDHEMGPWCPHTINDGPEKGGKWFKDGKIYDVDGEFIKELPVLYHDDFWKLYDEDGNILRTDSEEDCIKLMGAQLQDEFINYCIECLPSYISNLSKTYLIPVTPVKLENPISLSGQPKDGDRPDGPPQGEAGEKPQGPPPEMKREVKKEVLRNEVLLLMV